MADGGKINSFVGFCAGVVLSIFTRQRRRPSVEDIKKMEFFTSTQRIGVRFGSKIRNVFRLRWLRKV